MQEGNEEEEEVNEEEKGEEEEEDAKGEGNDFVTVFSKDICRLLLCSVGGADSLLFGSTYSCEDSWVFRLGWYADLCEVRST